MSEVRCRESREPLAVSRRLFVRPMTMADKPAVLRVSSRIWEGNDYVPLFFDRWAGEGGFWAAELRGRIVGYGKATQLSPGEWWLEGLRVDPDCRKRGIGKELSRQVLHRTLDERPASLRLATADVNHESLHIIETVMKFKPYAQYRFFVGKPGKPRPGPALIAPSASEALDYIERSGEFGSSRGLLQHTWLFRHVDRRYVAEMKRGGYVFGCRVAGKLAGLMIFRPHRYRGNDLDISFVAGNGEAIATFRSFLTRVAHDCGTNNMSGMAASREMAAALKSLGLRPHPHIKAVLVYEYPI
jgi:GNAT superfamily N-acetyltransferase